jgi:hypothetical protein
MLLMLVSRTALTLILLWFCCLLACGGRPKQQTTSLDGIDNRERIYARFGAPARIETHANDDKRRPPEEGEGDSFPFEVWSYSHLDGIGENVELEFVDTCLCGGYKLVPTPATAKITAVLADET